MALSVPEVKLTIAKTEYGRNKVALSPGKGLMDWIKISTNRSLASQKLPFVTAEELVKHNTENDCWILLRGNVYDVTKYLEYHPGGIPELMRAAGTEADKLFDQYHAWVNYCSMLKACHVGPFKGSTLKLPRPKNPIFDANPALKVKNASGSLTLDEFGLCASKPDNKTIRIRSSVGNLELQNLVVDVTSKTLRLVIRRFDSEAVCVVWDGFDWSNRNFFLKVISPKSVDVVFEASKALDEVRIFSNKVTKYEEQVFHPYVVEKKEKMTHDSFLFNLKPPSGLHLPVPIGHYLLFRLPSGLPKPFTPITYRSAVCTEFFGDNLRFFIKVYPNGQLTPALAKLEEGDTIELSEPIGRKDIGGLLEKNEHVLILAAGSGITPMINIIEHRRKMKKNGQKTILYWFNKKEEDICENIIEKNDFNFSFMHILSDPSSNWTGERGRIRTEILEKPNLDWKNALIFICGPMGFNNAAMDLLIKLKVASERVIVFQ